MNEPLEMQTERLANYIMANVPGEPSRSEGAIDCAIRIMRDAPALKWETGKPPLNAYILAEMKYSEGYMTRKRTYLWIGYWTSRIKKPIRFARINMPKKDQK